ncbi:MAG: helix-turn-helix domain-containing protein [Streptococcaceae bacterium]|jgi:predicted DNA-binding protein YlxM (UPF0122 family)|nr:helix-turn-helix domain-containing protein [Streptococcaceae bacterium]
MKEFFFDNKKNNLFDFIRYCWQSQKQEHFKKNICEELNLTPVVLEGIIQEIEELCEEYSGISIISNQQTINLSFKSSFLINKVYVMLFKETIGYKFLSAIFEEKFLSLEQFADENFVSARTIQRQMKSLSQLMKRYELNLSLKKKELILGEEYRIRHFFLAIFWHAYEERDDFYIKYQHNYELFKPLVRNRVLNLTPGELKKLFLLLRITQWRLKHGHTIHHLPLSITEVRHPFYTRQYFKENLVDKYFRKSALLNEEEINYLYYMFTVLPVYNYECIDKVNHIDNFFNADYQILTSSLLENFYKLTKIQLTQREEKFLSLNTVYQSSYYLSFGSKDRVASFTDAQYFLFEEKRRAHIHELADLLADSIPLDDTKWQRVLKSEAFRFSIFQMLVWVLGNHEHLIRVAFLTKYGKIHGDILANRLKHLSPRPVMIVDFRDEPDVVITDYYANEPELNNTQAVFIGWSVKPSEVEWLRTIDTIDRVREDRWEISNDML